MWKLVLVFCVFVTVSKCEHGIKKPYYDYNNHYGLSHGAGILYYLTFLIVKIKIAFVVGGFLIMILFFGKIFALVKFSKYMMGEMESKQVEPQKIYIQAAPAHDHDHSHESPPIHDHDHDSPAFGPPGYLTKRSPPKSSYLDHPPIGQESMNTFSYSRPPTRTKYKTLPTITSTPNYFGHGYSSTPSAGYQQRNFQTTLFNDLNKVARMMDKLDMTEMAFKAMNMKDVNCRRKYVCEVDVAAKTNSLISLGYSLFGRYGLAKYRSEKKPANIQECTMLYPSCKSSNKTR